MNLARIGEFWARWRPDEMAVKYDGETTTWRELNSRTSDLAAGLSQRGIGKGDRIAVLLTNCPEWIDLTIAAWKLGALIVPINTRFAPAEVKYVTADAGARMLFTNDALVAATATVEGCEVIRVDRIGELSGDGTGLVVVDTHANDAAFICYTSGTTGDPKGAVLTHGSFNAASQAWAQALNLWPEDKLQLPFPLAFTGGLALWLYTYWSGAGLLLDNEVNIDRIFDNFEKEHATGFMAVPTIFQMLVDHPRWATADLSSWKKACSGGAVVPPSLLKAVQARGVPMLQMFSLTESSAAGTVLPAHDAFRKVGSAGIPVNHGSLMIADDDDNEVKVGEVGEILLKGPQIMKEYWNNPAATAIALRGGWLHTGDLGYVDAEGYLYVVDRKKDMLISGGLNVYPAELERLIATVPGVVEVAVVGVPDERWGETPLVIVFANGANVAASQVLEACRDNLADYKLPRYFHLSPTPLPRNMSGKILKRELRTQFADFPATSSPIR